VRATDGFEAWHVFDCGAGEILWITFVRDQVAAEESDDRTLQFISEELREFRLERRVSRRGQLIVSRARPALLDLARA
jgi:hypothetical protein